MTAINGRRARWLGDQLSARTPENTDVRVRTRTGAASSLRVASAVPVRCRAVMALIIRAPPRAHSDSKRRPPHYARDALAVVGVGSLQPSFLPTPFQRDPRRVFWAVTAELPPEMRCDAAVGSGGCSGRTEDIKRRVVTN